MEEKNQQTLEDLKNDLENLERYIEEFSVFLPLSVCTVNPTNIIVDINQAFKDLTNYNEDSIIGQGVEILFKDKELAEEFFKQILQQEAIKRQEMILVVQDKKEIPVSVSGSVRKDEFGNIIGFFLAISDISEIKKFQESLEEKVEERTQELQKKVKELERFYKLAVDRELKMIELKKEIKKIKKN